MEQTQCSHIHEVSFRLACPVHVGWNTHTLYYCFWFEAVWGTDLGKWAQEDLRPFPGKYVPLYFARFSFTSLFSITFSCYVLVPDATWFIRTSSTASKNLKFWDHHHIITNHIRKVNVFVMLELMKSKLFITPKYFKLP